MNSDIIKLRKTYEESRDKRANMIVNGSCKDFADYRMMTGQVTGLTLAITEINDLLEKQRKQDG